MASEDIRHIKAGMGGAGDSSVTVTSKKMWYPWEPDVITGYKITKDYQSFTMPGGHKYETNAYKGVKGAYMQPGLEGVWYDGSKKSNHKDHKYSPFAGGGVQTHSNVNAVKQPLVEDSTKQFPGVLQIYSKGYRNANNHGNCWAYYSKTYGYPLPVYGLTMMVTPSIKAGTIDTDGNYFMRSTAQEKYALDWQINFVHGLWKLEGSATEDEYVSKKLTPNGNNWEGLSDVDAGKYCFRDSSDFSSGAGVDYMGAKSQWFGVADKNEKGNDKPFKLNLLLPQGDNPPANSLFMGFTINVCYGTRGDASKTVTYLVHNVGVIDKVTADIMYNKPEYSGTNPKTSDLPHIICPKLVHWQSFIPKNMPFYGPMQTW